MTISSTIDHVPVPLSVPVQSPLKDEQCPDPFSVGGYTGEVHLETIIKDLRERFARVDVRVSPPLVAFRESVYTLEEAPEPQHKPVKVLPVLINPCALINAASR